MKVEYINPFIEASLEVINQTTNFKPTIGRIFAKNNSYSGDGVVILIGLTGKISGNVVLSLSKKLALTISSAMMFGMPVNELDEMSKSAIAELANMILGHTANIFFQNHMNIDITPPTVLTGENIQLTPTKSVTVCIPLNFDGGESLQIDVSYQES
ncbi:MAG: chemotaxis protein CheX [Clostridia bacterium]|nr:chemotaxis protein CheX [Clostridia bacterium]